MAHEMVLTWQSDPDAVNGYNLFRGTASGKESTTPINTAPIPQGTLTYTDNAVAAGQTYYYTICAIGASGVESAPSAEVSATIPIQAVAGLTAVAS
jgi:fibronectin type 3 domain-containing protein